MAGKVSEATNLSSVVTAAVQADDKIRARIASFVDDVLDECEHLLAHGATPVKMTILRTVLSTAVKDISKSTSEDEHRAQMRAEVDGLFASVRENYVGHLTVVPTGDATTDAPPAA